MSGTVNDPRRVFLTTRWTEVIQAAQAHAPGGAAALENLCGQYWYPLYAYVRRQGFSPHDAQDLTQAFFARFLEKNFLAQVDRARGKFRSFLLASLKHFLANEWDRVRAQKRGGGAQIISLDEQSAEARYLLESREDSNAEKMYERRWALTVLEQVLSRLERECTDAGKTEQFGILKDHLTGGGTEAHADLAKRMNMTPAAVKVAIHRLRKRYRALLREEIALTVSKAAEVDAELRYLFSIISG
jgi:DNA-directed RNA polymerase specialized sigma24 family protein